MWNLQNWHKWTCLQNINRITDLGSKLRFTQGERECGYWRSGINIYTQCGCVLSCFSCVWFFVTLWMVAHQAPLSIDFSRQEHWSGLPVPPPGGLLNPGVKPVAPYVSCVGRWVFTPSTTWEVSTYTHDYT